VNCEQAKKLEHPTQVMIQTTSRCNSACVICPYPKVMEGKTPSHMDQALYTRLVDELADYPPLQRLMLYLMNEPLCDPKIVERIRYAREKLPDTEIYILTNGINLSGKLADEILDAGLTWMGLSVHAYDPKTYETITGRKDFAAIRKRLDAFIDKAVAKNGPDFLQVNVTRIRPHVSEEEFNLAAEHWRSTGVARVDLDDGYISRAGNVEVYGHAPVVHQRLSGCDTIWAYVMAHVLADGSVVPCCMDWQRKQVWGSVAEKPLLDIWRGEKRTMFLDALGSGEKLDPDFLCASCEDAVPVTREKNADEDAPDILLIQPPPWWAQAGPPLGLASLAAYLDSNGFTADLYDANIEMYDQADDENKEYWEWEQGMAWLSHREVGKRFGHALDAVAEKIAAHPASVVGFSVSSRREIPVAWIVRRLLKLAPEKTILFGGPGVQLKQDRDMIRNFIGPVERPPERPMTFAFVIGEGEEALTKILSRLKAGRGLDGIEGVAVYNKSGQAHFTPRETCVDLATLPFPDFTSFPLDLYPTFNLPSEWSRGCIGNCAFCTVRGLWGKYRAKPAMRVVDEIEHLITTIGRDMISVFDPVANGDPAELEKICDEVIRRKLEVKWAAGVTPVRPMGLELFAKMKKAGCYRLEFGIESASENVLKKMGKRFNLERAGRMLQDAHDAGIQVVLYLIVGFPGETEADFNETIDFLVRHTEAIDLVRSVNGLVLLPGSRLLEKPEKYGLQDVDKEQPLWVTRWSVGENTPELRADRIERMALALEKGGITVEYHNAAEVLPQGEKAEELLADTLVLPKSLDPGGSHKADDEEDDATTDEKMERIDKRLTEFEKKMRRFTALQNRLLSDLPVDSPDALLVMLPPWGVDFPPLGVASLATYARSKGFTARAMDLNIDWYASCGEDLRTWWNPEKLKLWVPGETLDEMVRYLEPQIEAFIQEVEQTQPLIVGFSTNESNLPLTEQVAGRLKTRLPETVVVFGGPGVAWQYDRNTVHPGVLNGFVIGEGEHTLNELLIRLQAKSALPGVAGYQPSDLDAGFKMRGLIKPLDDLPAPDFSDFPLHLYEKRDLPVLFSRGCVGKCSYCNDYKITPKFRIKKPETLFEEIKTYKAKYGAYEFSFNDLLVNASLSRLENFCDLVIESKMKLQWTGQAVIDARMDGSLFKKLAEAGCVSLVFGAESFSPNVLKAMRKRFVPEEAVRVFSECRRAGIDVIINLIVGFPGETEVEFQETLSFVRENRGLIDKVSSLSMCIVTAQSDLEKCPEEYDIVLPEPEHWCQWHGDKHDNTYEIRIDRLKRALALLDELGIAHSMTNLYFESLEQG
jgi:radical SAM superfamily enzyme YgiQ (UPF0313 family)